jgi:tryptophan synthase beta subunit
MTTRGAEPLYLAEKLTAALGRAWITSIGKTSTTPAPQINNFMGQASSPKRWQNPLMRRPARASTGGDATAPPDGDGVCGVHGRDTRRQHSCLPDATVGCEVVPATTGRPPSKTRSRPRCGVDPPDRHTHYCLGFRDGTHPFPTIVRGGDFPVVISRISGRRSRKRGTAPDAVIACVRRRSKRSGVLPFHRTRASIIGSSAGRGRHLGNRRVHHHRKPGIFHGMRSYFAKDDDGQMRRCIPSPRGWIIPVSDRSTPGSTTPGGVNMWQ